MWRWQHNRLPGSVDAADYGRNYFFRQTAGGIIKLRINRWILLTAIIILLLSLVLIYYTIHSRYQIDDWYSIINDEKAKKITNSFLNNSSLTKYHVNGITHKYRERVVDFQTNIYDQNNNSIGWVLVTGDNAEIAAININNIEIHGSNYIKISPILWQKISESNKSSYCNCVLNFKLQLSENEKKVLVQNQKFNITFENKTSIKGVVPIVEINNIININNLENINGVI